VDHSIGDDKAASPAEVTAGEWVEKADALMTGTAAPVSGNWCAHALGRTSIKSAEHWG
jgi:hypothetical protein